MLNKFAVSNHVNAVTGHIVKTYKESYFSRFSLNSPCADKLFNEKADRVVIQMILCGQSDVIAELIDRKIYNKILETSTSGSN